MLRWPREPEAFLLLFCFCKKKGLDNHPILFEKNIIVHSSFDVLNFDHK
jgi:hypothetical protein